MNGLEFWGRKRTQNQNLQKEKKQRIGCIEEGKNWEEKKLEKEKLKGLTLDPHHHLYRNQGEGEEEEDDHDGSLTHRRRRQDTQNQASASAPIVESHHLHAQHSQQVALHEKQVLYGGLELSDNRSQLPLPPPPQKKRSYFAASSSLEQSNEHARLGEKMGEASHHHHHHRGLSIPSSSRLSARSAGGEIVEVHGGHIVRSTGRKDRHSKVCTAKGPRDRRVRLAAHTAIQFYDVQDRLGYDRPSKAVDWLIKKAKAAIDELAQLPAWKPTADSAATAGFDDEVRKQLQEEEEQERRRQLGIHQPDLTITSGHSSKRATPILTREEEHKGLQHRGGSANSNVQNASFLPPALDSDSIADTIKSFFPTGASTATSSSSMPFHTFPPSDLLPRSRSHNQDLRLSLQSFQDPILLHHHSQQHQNLSHHHAEQAQVFLGGTPIGFDQTTGWNEHESQASELSRFQRLAAWNAAGDGSSGSGGGYMFNSAPPPLLQQLLVQQLFSQRGPLQSSNTPSIRAWMDPSNLAVSTADHAQQPQHQHQHQHSTVAPIYPASLSGVGFSSGVGGFSGFHIPARIQGNEEEQIGYSDKPSSASSDSRH